LPLILTNYDYGRAYYDQSTFHYPAIQHFVAGGSLQDYSSATTPGYHLVLAAVDMWVSPSERVLKLAGFFITALLVWLIGERVSRSVPRPGYVVILLLPLLFSIYFMPAGVWLLPDNLAWLFVFCLLLLAEQFRDEVLWYIQVSAVLLAAVLVRQSNVWLCLVVYTVAVVRDVHAADRRLVFRRFANALLASLPCIGVLIYFVSLWHGMVPPAFADQHTSFNPAAAPYFLCVVAVYGVFYLPLIWTHVRLGLKGPAVRLLGWGALAGLCAALVAPTDWSPAAGRVSGLWNLTQSLPSVEHRSVLITVLSALGGMTGVLWLLLAGTALRIVAVAATLGFVASQCLSHFVYERYYAALVFFLIILLAADILSRSPPVSRAGWVGPIVLAVLNAGVLAAGLRGG